ncbi:MAG: hypothetical protein ABUS57_09050 [Pseudomonadota bacterium]
MATLEIDMDEDLRAWVRDAAAALGFTSAQMIEYLVILESGLRDEDALGRHIRIRDFTYRQASNHLRARQERTI